MMQSANYNNKVKQDLYPGQGRGPASPPFSLPASRASFLAREIQTASTFFLYQAEYFERNSILCLERIYIGRLGVFFSPML